MRAPLGIRVMRGHVGERIISRQRESSGQAQPTAEHRRRPAAAGDSRWQSVAVGGSQAQGRQRTQGRRCDGSGSRARIGSGRAAAAGPGSAAGGQRQPGPDRQREGSGSRARIGSGRAAAAGPGPAAGGQRQPGKKKARGSRRRAVALAFLRLPEGSDFLPNGYRAWVVGVSPSGLVSLY